MTAPAALRPALRRYERARFAPATAGADLSGVLPGRRYWLPALEAGFLALDGAAVRLTPAGLALAGPCAACGWASCRGCSPAPTASTPRNRSNGTRNVPFCRPAAAVASDQAEKQAIPVEIAASSLPIVLQKLPATAGATMTGVRRRQGDLYRRRAERALCGALRAYERTFFAPLEPGTDLSRLLRGKKRYWQGGGGAAGYLLGTKITAAGLAAARAYVPRSRPAPAPFSCCANLRGSADHGHAATCPATAPAFGATA